jgi:Zn-dependent protease
MLGWSMNLFRIRGIRLEVHFSFFLLLAFIAQEGWGEAGWPGLLWSVATILAFFTCVVLHELGHSFTAMHFGIGVRRILLMPIGGMAEFDDIPRQPLREFLMTIAGPAVNFLIVAVLWFYPLADDLDTIAKHSLQGLIEQVFIANLVMGCFNLLPAFPMDGGRILRALLATRLPYLRATFWAATTGKILAGLGVVIALAAPAWHLAEQPFYMLAVLFAFIFLAGESEYRAVKRREIDDAHWRSVLARIYEVTPPATEPPAAVQS